MVHIVDWSPVPEPAPPARPDPSSIPEDVWRRFESATVSVVHKVQPTVSSDHLGAAVIRYVQRLLWFRAQCQVFPFGSFPLKTYLPDGDIDLTAFRVAGSDENLAHEVHAILLSEEQRKDTEFEVKDVQFINAQVKLVKCMVQNISMDISFNQIGGLCKLCFLEKVDQKIGKNHLFKRSIILIKDWCYYESHLLGAQHGLISTYALETLVLHIFFIFHKSLYGPLAVLYRFLDYYSKFDWDNKGISLFGPVSLASLPELDIDPLDHDDGLLERREFFKECVETFSVPPKSFEKNARVFSRKFLNIVDPLKPNNNLGRSVSKGNFCRIRSAFDFGARKLGKILQLSNCSTFNELNQFFRNTLKINRTRLRPDVLVSSSGGGIRNNHLANDSVLGDIDVERVDHGHSPLYNNSNGDPSDQFNNTNISDSNNQDLLKQNEHKLMAEQKDLKVSRRLLNSDAASYVPRMRNGGVFCEASTASETCASPSARYHCAPHLFYYGKKVDVTNGTNLSNHWTSSKWVSGKFHRSFEDVQYSNGLSGSSPPLFGYHAYSSADLVDGLTKYNSLYKPENSQPDGTSNDILSDLSGDFDTNYNNLLYAQGCQQDDPKNRFYYQMMPPPSAHYRNTQLSLGHGPYSPRYFVLRPSYDHMAMGARGTGAYFFDQNMYNDSTPAGHGWRSSNYFHPNNYQKFHNFFRTDMIPSEESSYEPPLHIHVPGTNDRRVPSPMNIPVPSPSSRPPTDPKLPALSPSSQVERDFHDPLEVPSEEHASRNPRPDYLLDSGDFPPLSS